MALLIPGDHPNDTKAQRDAFGRFRISTPTTLFDSKLLVSDQPTLFWDDQQVSGSGTSSTYSQANARYQLAVSASTAGRRTRQTFRRFPYQPGKSQLVNMTFNLNGLVTGVTKRVGLFDDNNGLFFQLNGTTPQFVIRKAGVDRTIDQTNWNSDRLDGGGFSGETIDFTKCQIFFIDFQWLGVGEVRFGFIIGNRVIVAHEAFHGNRTDTVYISTPNLPIRYELVNSGSGAATTMDCLCCSVSSEAGQDDVGLELSADRGITPLTTGNDTNLYPLIGLRLKTTHVSARIKLISYNVLCPTTADYRACILFNPTLAGTAVTWTDKTNSALQISRPTGASTVSAENTLVASAYAVQTNASTPGIVSDFGGFLTLGSSIAEVSDQLWLCAQRMTGNLEDFYASIRWRETI